MTSRSPLCQWHLVLGLTLYAFAPLSALAQTVSVDSVVAAPEAQFAEADEALQARIGYAISAFDDFDDVAVAVRGGVVHLQGLVSDSGARERIRDLALAIPGVVYVVNDLDTDVAVDARVAPAVQRVRTYLEDALAYLPALAVALLVVIVFWFLGALTGRLRAPFEKMGLSPMLSNVIGRLIRFVTFVVGIVLALDVLGITALVGAVLGTAGVVGIAIGFAFQDIIENYLAGLILSIRQPFSLGDMIQIGTDEGKVMRMTSRELLLMTLDGNHVSIPNGRVFKGTVYNYTRNPLRRFGFEVGIDVEEDLTRVQSVGVRTLEALPGVMSDPGPVMRVKRLGDSNVLVVFFGWVDQNKADFLKVNSEAIRLVKSALDEAGVLMPEPIYSVKMQAVESLAPASVLERKAAESPRPPVSEQVKNVDVGVEVDIEEQIKEDLARSDEENLIRDQ